VLLRKGRRKESDCSFIVVVSCIYLYLPFTQIGNVRLLPRHVIHISNTVSEEKIKKRAKRRAFAFAGLKSSYTAMMNVDTSVLAVGLILRADKSHCAFREDSNTRRKGLVGLDIPVLYMVVFASL
jgi:hypothetical protein